MVIEFPYAQVVGKIPLLFQTVGEKGIPNKVDHKWLAQFGMASSNDRRLIPLLKFLEFIDAQNIPTEIWRQYRGAESRTVLGTAIRSSYSELFEAHPQAQALNAQDLTVFFRTRTNSGKDVVSKTTSTFRALIGLADFPDNEYPRNSAGNDAWVGDEKSEENGPRRRSQSVQHGAQSPVVINVTLQLNLPATDDPTVYDALFASLNKHVLSSGKEDDV